MTRRACLGALLLTACLDSPPSVGDDAGTTPLCGTTGVLRDEFDAESPVWERYGQTALEDGRVQLYVAPPDGTSGMDNTWWYQLAGGEATMRLRRVDVGDGALDMLLIDQAGDFVGLELEAGTLSLVQNLGGNQTAPAATPFQPDMLWWRLSESGGQISWQTSTDGDEWTDRGTIPTAIAGPVAVVVEISAQTTQAVVDIESFSPSREEDLCPVSALVDDFDGESPRWIATDVAGCTIGTAGALSLAYDGAEDCGLDSAEHFDLRGGEVALEVLEAGDCDPTLFLSVALAEWVPEIVCANDGVRAMVHAQVSGPGAPGELAAVEFDPAAQRLWRIRHDAGKRELVFETASEQGDDWSTLAVQPIDESAVRSAGVSIYISDDAADGDPGPVVVDRLDLVP